MTIDSYVVCGCRTTQQALLTAPWPLELLSHPKACICSAKADAVTAKTAQYLQPSEVLLRVSSIKTQADLAVLSIPDQASIPEGGCLCIASPRHSIACMRL